MCERCDEAQTWPWWRRLWFYFTAAPGENDYGDEDGWGMP